MSTIVQAVRAASKPNMVNVVPSMQNRATSMRLMGREEIPREYTTPVCLEKVIIKHKGILEYLRTEARRTVDPRGRRWALFDAQSPSRLHTGSIIRLSYRPNKMAPWQTIVGCLVAMRRNPGDPTFILKSVVDGVAVDQTFCIFSPLLESIEVLQSPKKPSQKKLYKISEMKVAELQRNLQKKLQQNEAISPGPLQLR